MNPRRFAAGLLAVLTACSEPVIGPWPPVVGQRFPDMDLLDHRGDRVRLSTFAGKVVMVEPIGMSCAGCIALCGGHDRGAFEGAEPQEGLEALEEVLPRFGGGVQLDDDGLVVVQLLFFNRAMGTPTVAEARAWYDHFEIGARRNHVVLIGPESLRDAAYGAIPGYWLLDRDFVLRYDATGHHPRHNLYTDLLPAVRGLLAQGASAAPR